MANPKLPQFLETSDQLSSLFQAIVTLASQQWLGLGKPYMGRSVQGQEELLDRELPHSGRDLLQVIDEVGREIVRHCLVIHHPKAIAHFHCTPTLASVAAEFIIALTNQSMDSWDQSPSATMIELLVLGWLCDLVGWTCGAGVFTAGGTMANQMAVLLARNFIGKEMFGVDLQRTSVSSHPWLNQCFILTSEQSHFSVRRAASLVGLGEQAVIAIPADQTFRLRAGAAEQKIRQLAREGRTPMMVIATAGTTGQGVIDELQSLANVSREANAWFHVDASHSGALLFSERYRHLIDGLGDADSIALDPHKFLFQNISCGCFLLRKRERFDLIETHVDYLNPEEDEIEGIRNLVGHSLQTTRRFDALKLFMTIEHLGVKEIAKLIDQRIDLTRRSADFVRGCADLQLACEPVTNVLVFRFRPQNAPAGSLNDINRKLQHRLFLEGYAAISKIKLGDDLYLKASIFNPNTTETDMREVLDMIRRVGTDILASQCDTILE